jgi:hypothetical protein
MGIDDVDVRIYLPPASEVADLQIDRPARTQAARVTLGGARWQGPTAAASVAIEIRAGRGDARRLPAQARDLTARRPGPQRS